MISYHSPIDKLTALAGIREGKGNFKDSNGSSLIIRKIGGGQRSEVERVLQGMMGVD